MNGYRLKTEIGEMKTIRRLWNFCLYEDTTYSRNSWRRYFWTGRGPTGHTITARYSRNHPCEKMDIEVSPDVSTHHKHGRYICYLKDSQWNSNWTAASAILTAFRFLEDYELGRL